MIFHAVFSFLSFLSFFFSALLSALSSEGSGYVHSFYFNFSLFLALNFKMLLLLMVSVNSDCRLMAKETKKSHRAVALWGGHWEGWRYVVSGCLQSSVSEALIFGRVGILAE